MWLSSPGSLRRGLFFLIVCLLVTGCSWNTGIQQERNELASPPSPEPSSVTSDSLSEVVAIEPITLLIVQNKVEVADVFKRIAEVYHEEHPEVLLHVETYGGGEDFATRLTTMLRAANPPDIFTNEGYALLTPWLSHAEDLSDQPWVRGLLPGVAEPVTVDGRIYGFPIAYEGFGFAYNKMLFKRAGILKEPDTLKSLEEACLQLEASGIQPFVNTYAEWWVLGNHHLNIPLGHQPDPAGFIASIARGEGNFASGTHVQEWLHLLDLTWRYGQPDATRTGDYSSTISTFASGGAAMIQQGNWIQPLLDKLEPGMEVGFLPMPIGAEPDQKIYAGVPNFFLVNQASQNKQEAMNWLSWLVFSETGQRHVVEELKYVPCHSGIPVVQSHGLNAALEEKLEAGDVYSWEFPRLPNGASMNMAVALSRYLEGEITQEELFERFDWAIRDGAARAGMEAGTVEVTP